MKKIFIIALSYIILVINSNLLAQEKDKLLKVGLLAPLTGEYEELGKSLLYSLQLALEEIGDEKIYIVPRDAGFNNKVKLNKAIKELNSIKHLKEKIILGGAVTIESFLEAIRSKMPELVEILQRFGSPQIRNQGTIGGNLCTSSPIGDIAPVLLVLNSDLNLFGRNGYKKIKVKNFFKGYRKNVLKKNEIISSIEIPYPDKKNKIFSWKLSKRYDQDISTVSLAINIQIQNNIIKELHIAAGGVAATPKMLDKLSKRMLEKNLDDAIEFAIHNLENHIQPISDLRGSSHYRLEAIKGLFRRLQICLNQDKKNLSIMEL